MKLGKKPYEHDPKTAKLAEFLDLTAVAPSTFDFDKGRAKFPTNTWSNNDYGDCVMAARTNHLLRLERSETRRTVPITKDMVVKKYFELTGGPDEGLVIKDTLGDWRKNGWDIKTHAGVRHYDIAAYGELNPKDRKQLRLGCYLLHGIQFGFDLPISAQPQTQQGFWEVTTGPDSEPGSWGGHCVASFAYDFDSFYVWTWGLKVKVSNAFIEKYADEAWAVVDDWDRWREAFDIEKLKGYLKGIGATGIQ